MGEEPSERGRGTANRTRPTRSIRRRVDARAAAIALAGSLLGVAACAANGSSDEPFEITSDAGTTLRAVPLGVFEQPWAMTFLPDGRLLVTEKPGRLLLVATDTDVRLRVEGLPPIRSEGQGGLGDVVLHPRFADNRLVYLSYVEHEGGTSGAVVARARLGGDADAPALEELDVIWRQVPKVTGSGHYGHRLAFSPDGFLFVSSGERQKFTPAQDLGQNLGKLVRLHDDGTVPTDNPFADEGGVAAEIWSLGHRNPLGLAFDADGRLWQHEMGPRGGDELNRIERGANYGYPLVSNGEHYNGLPIPDHDTRPDFAAPATSWSPVISPAGLVVVEGERYPGWAGSALIGGLSSEALVRVALGTDGAAAGGGAVDASTSGEAREIERFAMPTRVREVEIGPDGAVHVLEDRSGARLLRLDPPG